MRRHGRIRETDFVSGSGVLRFPGQRIVVAPVAKMQKAARGHEGTQGCIELLLKGLGKDRIFARPDMVFFDGREKRQPVNDVVIAQSSRSVLQIGFEMKYGIAEFSVARARKV